jgi:hypothetical protein
VFFLFSRQAMPNYWYLVAVAALLGSIDETGPAKAGLYARSG